MIRKCKAFQWASGKRNFKSFSVWTTFLPDVRRQRCASLWIWVSTGNEGTPNAWAITTLAVLCPTPGSFSSASWSLGTWPEWFSTKRRESSEMALDFLGDKPHGRMILRIWSTGTCCIFSGVSAKANKEGVMRFTRLSVHWADKRTATRSVYVSLWSKGIRVFG